MLEKSKIIILLAIILLIVGGFFVLKPSQEDTNFKEPFITINNARIEVELADTPETRMQGLSGRESLKEDKGLLFIFPESSFYSFWMKEMNFPIDIIWINDEFEVVDIEHSLTPNTFPESFGPQNSAKYVLEINAGLSEYYGIKIGSKIIFNNIETNVD